MSYDKETYDLKRRCHVCVNDGCSEIPNLGYAQCERHLEMKRRAMARYKTKNGAKVAESQKKWREKHPDYFKVYDATMREK